MKQIKQFIAKLDEAFNINTHFPGYSFKPIFITGFALIIIVFFYVSYIHGFDINRHSYIKCADTIPCQNPLYFCNNPDYTYMELFALGMDCNRYKNIECLDGVCDIEIIEPGQSVGIPEPGYFKMFKFFVFNVLIICFIVNHIFYMIRKKKGLI